MGDTVAKNEKKYCDDDYEETDSDDDSMRSLEQEEDTMHSGREMNGESMHSMSERRSMHSTSGRMGKVQFTRNNCNDTVVSSLSGNTQSLQSVPSKLMSPKSKTYQKNPFLLGPTPEYPSQAQNSELARMLSPGPSNRSGHSFANSIVSASPRADYRSPSVVDRPDTSFMDTLEEKPSSTSQESAGNSAELLDAAVEAALEDMEIIDSPRTNPSANSLQILSSSSTGRSNSPLGFVFKDSEESDHMIPPAPEAKGFVREVVDNSASNEILEKSENVSKQVSEPSKLGEVSTSTKRTVSTSIRTGMSSIQNGDIEATKSDHSSGFDVVDRETYEGSTSIRTGLSGIQRNSMENSISIHMTVPSEDKDATEVEQPGVTKYPDTIQEDNEVKSTQKSVSTKDESSASFGLKVKPTATTDRSSGLTTGGSTSSDQASSDPSGTMPPANVLPPLQTEGNEETSNNGFSLLSPGSRSSRAWKSGFGKSIGNALKTVLAKASPRNSGHQSKNEENEEGGSLFEDDDDDIFGGLEVEENPVKPVTTKKQKLDDKTPRLNNVMPNDTRDPSASRRTSVSISRRTNESLSRRTNESFSRRANGSTSRRTSKSRKSIESGSTRKMRTGGMDHPSPNKKLPKTPSQQKRTTSTPSAKPTSKATSKYPNDKSGMIVDGSDHLHNVNSDITSSLIGGPISGQSPFQKAMKEASKLIEFGAQMEDDKEVSEEIPEPEYSKEEIGGSFTKFMEESDASSVEQREGEPLNDEETMHEATLEEEEDGERLGSMFLNFGCGLVDTCGGFASLCTPGDKAREDVADDIVAGGDGCENKDSASVSSRSDLTSLEKKVWNEWDRLNEGPLAPKKANEAEEEQAKDSETMREEAKEKLLEIVNTETEHSEQFEKSTLVENDDHTKTTASASEGGSVSASGSTESESESRFTKESESEGSGNSFGNSLTSGESLETLSQDSTRGTYSTTSYSTGEESDAMSEDPSRSGTSRAKSKASRASRASSASGPILLSFSQRSLMEKFSKQLTAVGVEVLKLNTRKQWQTRHFTISMEQIALSAHEAISKTGELAQCPKALLWLKKFNPKSGGYGIVNIDKNGHGGMLLVDLVDVEVSERNDDMIENPIPKKLLDRFQKSALVTLKYKMKGILRSIEFRCRDSDEAQFLCTCMRVIRDLLRRERSLRQKLSKQALKNK